MALGLVVLGFGLALLVMVGLCALPARRDHPSRQAIRRTTHRTERHLDHLFRQAANDMLTAARRRHQQDWPPWP